MRLQGIRIGDMVEVDIRGRRFHAIVTGSAPGGLQLRPTDRRVGYYSCRSRDVIEHWVRRGSSRGADAPALAASGQLAIELDAAPDGRG